MAERILSCFIDESGDFGPYEVHSPFYFIAVVLHDQDVGIAEKIAGLEERATNLGYPKHAIHTGPLIRREGVYKNNTVEERKRLFNVLYYFSIHLPIQYFCVKVNKSECKDNVQQNAKLSKLVSMKIQERYAFWRQFDKIIVYYDNGQMQVTKLQFVCCHHGMGDSLQDQSRDEQLFRL